MLRDNHREEFLFDNEIPDISRHIGKLVADLPVVEHLAELLAGPIEKSLFFIRQLWRRIRHQTVPIRHAREELAVPPYVACFKCLALGVRHRRQHVPVYIEQRFRELLAPNFNEIRQDHQPERGQQDQVPQDGAIAEKQVCEYGCTRRDGGRAQVNSLVGQENPATCEQQKPK